MGKGRKKSKSHASADAPSAGNSKVVVQGLVGLACTVATAYLGMGLFGLPPTISFGLGPVVGIVAALACRPLWLAAPVAAVGLALGTLAGWPFIETTFGLVHRPTSYAVHALIAAVVAIGAGLAITINPRWRMWLAWAAVALTIVATWQCGWFEAELPQRSLGTSSLKFYDSTPSSAKPLNDDQVFLLTVRRMQAGSTYYSAMRQTLAEANAANPTMERAVSSPVSYRLPTLYWLLAALRTGSMAWLIAMLTLISAAVIAAWTIAARFVAPHVALVGVVAVASYLHAFTVVNLAETEMWAGPLALVAVALALHSLATGRRQMVWAILAAAVALLATLTRELAVGFLLVGLASTLVQSAERAKRLWVPWAAAMAIAVVAYVAHVGAVASAASGPLQFAATSATHFDPSGAGLVASVLGIAGRAWWPPAVGWVLWVLGTAGSVAAARDWATRALLGGVAVGGAAVLLVMHPAGTQGALVAAYWGYIVLPTAMACCMLLFSRVPYLRAESVEQ